MLEEVEAGKTLRTLLRLANRLLLLSEEQKFAMPQLPRVVPEYGLLLYLIAGFWKDISHASIHLASATT